MDNTKAVLTVYETQELLGLSRSSVYQGIQSGEIPSIRVGKRILVPKAALEKLLNGRLLKSKDEVN